MEVRLTNGEGTRIKGSISGPIPRGVLALAKEIVRRRSPGSVRGMVSGCHEELV